MLPKPPCKSSSTPYADWCFSRGGFGPVDYVVFLESPLTIALDKIDNIR